MILSYFLIDTLSKCNVPKLRIYQIVAVFHIVLYISATGFIYSHFHTNGSLAACIIVFTVFYFIRMYYVRKYMERK